MRPQPVGRDGRIDANLLGRAAVALLGSAAVAGLAWWLVGGGPTVDRWFPGCLFHRWTGLHCPGCGTTRALRELAHLDVLGALRLNILAVPLLPLVAVGLMLELLGWVCGGGRAIPELRPKPWFVKGLVVVLVAFWILRNLPWWPFTTLAP